MKKIILLLYVSVLFLTVSAQVKTTKKIEIELEDGFINESVEPFGKFGILSCAFQRNNRKMLWQLTKYDTDLEKGKSFEFIVPRSKRLYETYTTKSMYYMLFRDIKNEYLLYSIDVESMKFSKVEGTLPRKLSIIDLKVLNNKAIVSSKDRKAYMLFGIDLKSGEKEVININVPGYKINNINIENIQILDKTQEAFVFLSAINKKDKLKESYVLRLNDQLKKEKIFQLQNNRDMTLIDLRASHIKDDVYVYTGTYSEKFNAASIGVFFGKTNNDKIEFMKFYKFLDFENFLSYLPQKNQNKIEKKRAKKTNKGKDLKVGFLMAIHDIEYIDGQYLFLGESYYPTYRTETYTTTDANGNSVTRTRSVFDGYQYTHATLASFNDKGEKNWDNTFKMYPSYKPMRVMQFVNTSLDREENKINLLFSSRSVIKSISFNTSGKIENEREVELLEIGKSGEKIKRAFSRADYWYDKYFVSHGAAKLKDTNGKVGKKKRFIYFINKISFE